MSVIFPGLSYRQMYRKFKKVVLHLLAHVRPPVFFSRILRSEALVYNCMIKGFFGGLKFFILVNLASIFLGGLVYIQVGTFLGI